MEHDFTNMSDGEIITACGDSARLWAEAFCQKVDKSLSPFFKMDRGIMTSWFANAIEAAWDIRTREESTPEVGGGVI